jgi:hypothetical protein
MAEQAQTPVGFDSLEAALSAVSQAEPSVQLVSDTPAEVAPDGAAIPNHAPPEASAEEGATSSSESDTVAEPPAEPDAKAEQKPEAVGQFAKRLRDKDRKREAAHASKMAQLDARMSELDRRLKSTDPLHEAAELARKDWYSGFERFCEITGTDPATGMQRYAGRVLGKEEDPVISARREASEARAKAEALEAKWAERDKQEQERSAQAQRQYGVDAAVAEIMRVREPEFASRDEFSAAAALPEHVLRAAAQSLVTRYIESGESKTVTDVAIEINSYYRGIRDAYLSSQPGLAGGGKSAPASSEALAVPTGTVGGAIRSARRDQITNRDAAGSVGQRPMTQAERDAKADEILQKAWTVG